MNGEHMVLIPFNGEFLALTHEEFEQARTRGRELVGKHAPSDGVTPPDEVLTAEQMSERTHIPASWFYEASRQGKIPCIKAGKYTRFRLNETLDSLKCESIYNMRRKSA